MELSPTEKLIADVEKKAKRGDLFAKNVLHLLDLKRAGHSPTRTEYSIPSDMRTIHSPKDHLPIYSSTSTSAGW